MQPIFLSVSVSVSVNPPYQQDSIKSAFSKLFAFMPVLFLVTDHHSLDKLPDYSAFIHCVSVCDWHRKNKCEKTGIEVSVTGQ